MPSKPPFVLIILDGFGEGAASGDNAISEADPRFWWELRQSYPLTTLDCSGEQVGLPCGLMGNSEVGHLNIGAGRIVWQDISRIDRSISEGDFFENPALLGAVDHASSQGSNLHLFGLLSDGGVHSSDKHLRALLDLAKRRGLDGDRVLLHAFLDGRDTPPRSALRYIEEVEEHMAKQGVGRIATVSGRYYAMDRDRRWDRVQLAYDAMTSGQGEQAESASAAVRASYERDQGDEFVLPTVVGSRDRGRIRDGDAVLFFNFRADRARQMSEVFLGEEFDGFPRAAWPKTHYVTMTRYREDFGCPEAFAPQPMKGLMPEVVAKAGLRQLRIAETEKYAHVTFFLSGGDERELPGESRILVPSPKVATYDLQPGMSAVEVTDRLLAEFDKEERPEVVFLNFANADMVGHTGILPAAVQAVRTIDQCLSRIVPRVLELGGHVAITADHGNCEMMRDPDTGKPHTAHTTNPVPFLLVGDDLRGASLRPGGRLCDIATTVLPILGLDPDPSMQGVNLL